MSSRGRSHERVGPAPLPPRRERHRGCLLLSLIVLIGNIAATGLRAIDADLAVSREREPVFSSPGSDAGIRRYSAVDAEGNPPFRVRQKYLLGYRVDINRAGVRELSGLPGISDATAAALVTERTRIGRFRRPRDLLRVRGIKEKRLKKILPFLSGFHNN